AKFWLDRDTALQPACKFGWGGNGALECDLLWHNYRWIPSQGDEWPVYAGFGAALDTAGPWVGGRGVVGVAYLLEDLPGDFFVQLVPTYWFGGAPAAFQLYGETGLRLFL
ncbi:MAG TPA: hypothetical protein VFR02_06040, partial [bacterium]|nr:hypothetical protein [bacterium]